jgi:ATP-dependent DNA helicase RecG
MSIKDEIIKGENRRLEYKRQLPSNSNIAKTVVAFSNGAGGNLIVGIANNGEISGVSDHEVIELPDRVSNIIYDSCYPAIIPEIFTENVDGKNILIVKIYPGNLKPYYIKSEGKVNGTYIRVGATNKLADNEMIIELERQRRNVSFDEECQYNFPIDKLSISKLKSDFMRLTGRELDDKGLINLKLVKEENGINYPTNAAILLSDSEYFEFARVKCARFKGTDVGEFIDQKEYCGPLYEQVENVMKFAKMYIPKKGQFSDLQRQDQYEVPLVAIREAVANAIVHRDYSISGADIKFAIFDDRIEITSPGVLPKTLDIQDIKSGRSEIRNKVIARFFKELRFIEEWGTGIRRIITLCKSAGLREPDFIETGMHFKVVLYKHGSELVAESSGLVAESSGLDKYSYSKLTHNEKAIINYLQSSKSITNKEGMQATGLSPAGVRKIISALQKKGLIDAIGEGRSRYYVLKDPR